MFTREELDRPLEELAPLLRERTAGLEADRGAAPAVRDAALLFELDHQVRNGGFAQYFFNQSCPNAFDAWFASEVIDPTAQVLLEKALLRLGAEFDLDLDLRRIVKEGGGAALGPAYGGLLRVYSATHQAPGELLPKFARFRDRLAIARSTLVGFDQLNRSFFEETNLPPAIAQYAKDESESFLTSAP